MLPKEVLLQSFKPAWHVSKFVFTIAIGDSQTCTDFQTSSTILWQPSFCNQTCSNRQGLWCRIGIPKGWITIGLWPEHPHSKRETFDAGNKATQSPFAKTLSSLSPYCIATYNILVPNEFITKKTKILEPTLINHISEFLHLSYWTRPPTHLLMRLKNLVKIPCT